MTGNRRKQRTAGAAILQYIQTKQLKLKLINSNSNGKYNGGTAQ
ncbi:hypothetical protein [Rhodovulum sp. YNF3179]